MTHHFTIACWCVLVAAQPARGLHRDVRRRLAAVRSVIWAVALLVNIAILPVSLR